MKKHRFTIRVLLATLALTAVVSASAFVMISTTEVSRAQYAGGSGGNEVICSTGYRDFSTFISSTIGFFEFSEYWKDILVRYNANICHYQDIYSLVQRLDRVRTQIRRAFYVCADTTRLKDTYYLLEAEIFFLRNFIETDNSQFIVKNDARLFKEFKKNFGKRFTRTQLESVYDRFKTKYTNKLETYRNCKDGSWEALVNKWEEFKENAGGIGPALQRAKRQIESHYEKMANTSMDLGRDFIGGFVDVKINGLPVEEGLDQIMDEFDRNMPGGYSFQQLQVASDYSKVTVDYAEQEANYLINYFTLYHETSDDMTEKILARLNMLNRIIESTYPYENQTIQCTTRIVDKQCP
ncbi:hypothetical protein ACFL2V_04210 [Pseudomonadota bacterium]